MWKVREQKMLSGIFYAFLHFVPPKSVNLGGPFAINMEVIS